MIDYYIKDDKYILHIDNNPIGEIYAKEHAEEIAECTNEYNKYDEEIDRLNSLVDELEDTIIKLKAKLDATKETILEAVKTIEE